MSFWRRVKLAFERFVNVNQNLTYIHLQFIDELKQRPVAKNEIKFTDETERIALRNRLRILLTILN